jgi:hypothetical protein
VENTLDLGGVTTVVYFDLRDSVLAAALKLVAVSEPLVVVPRFSALVSGFETTRAAWDSSKNPQSQTHHPLLMIQNCY